MQCSDRYAKLPIPLILHAQLFSEANQTHTPAKKGDVLVGDSLAMCEDVSHHKDVITKLPTIFFGQGMYI